MTRKGWYVLKYGGGRYTSVAWFAHREQAEAEVKRILLVGSWQGMPPKIEAIANAREVVFDHDATCGLGCDCDDDR